ncbi:ImmA/IrrE family metallo-endopeptidase [Enterococcus sp.]|uniref:ImmA/IrrE family metallo-endopeptidase n=1 Tax=Enterococcus sp. TaxID=35783 RepID=UPI00399112F7
MNRIVTKIIDELSVTVKYENIKRPGYYIAKLNIIVINSNLSVFEQTKTLLHELGHASKHFNNYKMYNLAFSLHSKMENEAVEFMIERMIEVRLNDPDFNPATFNSFNFLESYKLDLSYEPVVREFMTNYFVNVNKDYIFF